MEGAYVTRQVTGNKNCVDIARRLARITVQHHGCCEKAIT
jgi:hypothetical protein